MIAEGAAENRAGIIVVPLGNSLFGAGYALWFVFAAAASLIGGLLVYRIRGVR